jgi:hypothetical protein
VFGFIGPRLVSFDPLEFNGDTKEILALPAVSEGEYTILDGLDPRLVRTD